MCHSYRLKDDLFVYAFIFCASDFLNRLVSKMTFMPHQTLNAAYSPLVGLCSNLGYLLVFFVN